MSAIPPIDGNSNVPDFDMDEQQPKPQPSMFPNIIPDEEEQKEIISKCKAFKQATIAHARQKKEDMKTCYAYAKNQFIGNDLLPIPSTSGGQNDTQNQRPKVFIPVVRQQLKQLYSSLKLTLFPNDEDYFRIRGVDPEAAEIEDELTEALKLKFKEAMIAEKIGAALWDVCWAGNAAILPTIKDNIRWEWSFDPVTQQYVANQVDVPPEPDLETLNPIQFYLDPSAKNAECAGWGHYGSKKKQEIKDSTLYFNTDKLDDLKSTGKSGNETDAQFDLTSFNGLVNSFTEVEGGIDYDLFYFPYLKTKDKEYRNMLVGMAGGQVLVRFHPNLFPGGMNPVVFFNWSNDVGSPYGTGPVEDIKELQRLINILYNYMIEALARIGNRFVVRPDVDLTNLFGLAGGVATAENPSSDILPLTGNYTEISELANIIGTIKAEAQVSSGSSNPFQGASQIDFKKTATELQIMSENSISVLREIIEHITITGMQRALELLMYLCADLYKEPVVIRRDDPMMGTQFIPVSLSVLKSGRFIIELIGFNPSQSKQAQISGLMQLLELVLQNPQGLVAGEPIIEKIGQLQGIKDISETVKKIKERMGIGGPQQPGIPNPQAGMGAGPQPPMGGVPQAPPNAASPGQNPPY